MSKNSKNIKFLTYNVFLRPPPIKTNLDDFKNERLNDILQEIQKFDIVCFQEMFQTATFRKQKVIQKAITKGFLYWKQCEPPMFWNGPPVDSGLLVLSKYPILSSIFQSYHCGILSDSASDKGFIYCKILVHQKIIHLFTTHLQASYLHPGMLVQRQLSIKTRLYQFRTLVNKIKQILSKSCKKPNQQLVLLMGDLNMNSLMCPVTLHGSVLESQKVGDQFIEYDSFMKIISDADIKAKNCLFENFKTHPITFGDGEHVLTDRLQSYSKQGLDFIFQLDVPIQVTNQNEKYTELSSRCIQTDSSKQNIVTTSSKFNCWKPIIQSARVEQFKIKDRPYSQLSDHYGLSIEVCLE